MKIALTMVAAVAPLVIGLAKEKPGNGMPEAARPEVAAAVSAAAAKPHPRLFADAAGFESLKERIGKEETVSRTVLYRVATLAMAYRLYGDKAHLDRAVAEMRAVCAFEDWNPSHFLDVGEMSLAVAVGYDWLYADLDEATRKEIAAGLRRCGLDASLKRLGWVRAHNNWGQVCHAGILSAALALAEENPADAARYVQRCIDMLPISMKALAPNGNYPEGPGYWSYGMHFNVIAIALLEGTLGSDFGLASMPGFREAGYYPDIVTGPSGQPFNYADGGAGRRGSHPALWWFAKRFKSPDVLRYQELENFKAYAARRDKRITTHGHRLFPFVLFWIETPPPSNGPSRLPLVWDGQGPVPITIQRSSWNDDEALFVGLKGGSPSGPHGHMDGGSFVMDTKGVRWAVDIGAENYYGIESRGMNLWSSAQDSDRWRVFRLSTWSHNVPMIDGCQQLVKGAARVTEVKREGASSEVTLDLSSLYTNATSVVRKGAMASDGRRYLLRDTFAGVRPGAQIRWAMMTCAEPAVDGDKVTLRQNGKTLTLVQCGAQKGAWTIGDGQGPNEWDSKNRGCRQLLFTVTATAEGTADIAVKFSF